MPAVAPSPDLAGVQLPVQVCRMAGVRCLLWRCGGRGRLSGVAALQNSSGAYTESVRVLSANDSAARVLTSVLGRYVQRRARGSSLVDGSAHANITGAQTTIAVAAHGACARVVLSWIVSGPRQRRLGIVWEIHAPKRLQPYLEFRCAMPGIQRDPVRRPRVRLMSAHEGSTRPSCAKDHLCGFILQVDYSLDVETATHSMLQRDCIRRSIATLDKCAQWCHRHRADSTPAMPVGTAALRRGASRDEHAINGAAGETPQTTHGGIAMPKCSCRSSSHDAPCQVTHWDPCRRPCLAVRGSRPARRTGRVTRTSPQQQGPARQQCIPRTVSGKPPAHRSAASACVDTVSTIHGERGPRFAGADCRKFAGRSLNGFWWAGGRHRGIAHDLH